MEALTIVATQAVAPGVIGDSTTVFVEGSPSTSVQVGNMGPGASVLNLGGVHAIRTITEVEYQALAVKQPDVLYIRTN